MRKHDAAKFFLSASATFSLVAAAACVGGPGQLPGEDGQQVVPNGSGSGSAGTSGSGGSSGSGSTPSNPGSPNVDPPPPVFKDAGTSPPFDSGVKDSGGTLTCAGSGQTSKFTPAACQTCLEQQCCSQLKTCFTIQGSGTKLGCNQYSDCLDTCQTDPDPTTCSNDCQTTAQTGVVTAYQAIVTCGESKCATQCQL